MLGNLVDNALDVVAYGSGQVEVDLREVGDVVEVVVSDDGPGVPPALVDEVFRHGFSTKVAAEGGERGWTTSTLADAFDAFAGGISVADADAWTLEGFLTALQNGQIERSA